MIYLLSSSFLPFIENPIWARRRSPCEIQMTYVKRFLTTSVNKTTISTLVLYDVQSDEHTYDIFYLKDVLEDLHTL